MKQTKFIAVVLLSFIILILFFSCENEQEEIPDFHEEALQIQEEYRPGFAVRKLKHLLIYCYGLCQEYELDSAAGVSCWVFLFVVECPVLMWC